MEKKTIKVPKRQARLLQAYLKISEELRKKGKFLLLRDFVEYAKEQERTEEKNGVIGLKDNVKF